MKKRVIILIFILAVIITSGYIFYSKVYMSDKNLLNRYLVSKGYTCVEDVCNMKKENIKYSMNVKNQELYISNNVYNLNIGKEYPVLKFKNGNKECAYQVREYNAGDLITDDFYYNHWCEKYLDEVNEYIEEYSKILVESNVKVVK